MQEDFKGEFTDKTRAERIGLHHRGTVGRQRQRDGGLVPDGLICLARSGCLQY
jgi:hypothetical protein